MPQGQHCQHSIHHGVPGKLSEDFLHEETHHGVPGLVFAMGQCAHPHSYHCGGLHQGEGHQGDPLSAQFSGTSTSRLLPLSNGEFSHVRHLLVPGQLQDDLGRGH